MLARSKLERCKRLRLQLRLFCTCSKGCSQAAARGKEHMPVHQRAKPAAKLGQTRSNPVKRCRAPAQPRKHGRLLHPGSSPAAGGPALLALCTAPWPASAARRTPHPAVYVGGGGCGGEQGGSGSASFVCSALACASSALSSPPCSFVQFSATPHTYTHTEHYPHIELYIINAPAAPAPAAPAPLSAAPPSAAASGRRARLPSGQIQSAPLPAAEPTCVFGVGGV